MKLKKHGTARGVWLALALFFCVTPQASAQVPVADNFTGGSASQTWRPSGAACLTAGNGTGSIPKCVSGSGGKTGTLPDPVGDGALRLTHAVGYQVGAVLSDFTFPSNAGLAVTFTSLTYGGSGADGLSFFLMDGSVAVPVAPAQYPLGATGGRPGAWGRSPPRAAARRRRPRRPPRARARPRTRRAVGPARRDQRPGTP